MEMAVDEWEHQPQSEAPEQLGQQQSGGRIAAQDRLVRQPLQQRDGPEHPEDEAERQSEEPATPRVIGCPLEQPPVRTPPSSIRPA